MTKHGDYAQGQRSSSPGPERSFAEGQTHKRLSPFCSHPDCKHLVTRRNPEHLCTKHLEQARLSDRVGFKSYHEADVEESA